MVPGGMVCGSGYDVPIVTDNSQNTHGRLTANSRMGHMRLTDESRQTHDRLTVDSRTTHGLCRPLVTQPTLVT